MDDELVRLDARAKVLSKQIDYDKRHGRRERDLAHKRAELTAIELQMQARIHCSNALDSVRRHK